jgi:hypothetical protein
VRVNCEAVIVKVGVGSEAGPNSMEPVPSFAATNKAKTINLMAFWDVTAGTYNVRVDCGADRGGAGRVADARLMTWTLSR